ncbi:TAP-like protein-domain-containing protein [Daldinia caldariorum]|uniref:TAP-like protein-domain-containing protein n=1 Tax=Daldinia caldariorum TaxID=326644 RepID=UPI0020075968|nr:TAP-like protein-domain-containing protein [Daldinia caldariorum]KAI1469765.1 TAP-like protein-domain-containing protein [Daldinia caldariorum]
MAAFNSAVPPFLGEKQSDSDNVQARFQLPREEPSWGWRRLSAVALTVISGILIIGHFGHGPIHYGYRHPELGEDQTQSKSLDGWTEWSSITPSEKLIWQPCFALYGDGFQCARLTVPMDHHRPLNQSADNPKVHLALVLKPGINRTADPASYSESPLLINPGGPGGSGAHFVLITGPGLQEVIGGNRDVIGFDPRGVGATTPKADCFASADDPSGLDGRNIALMNRLSWMMSGRGIGLVNSSNIALRKLDVRSRALAKLCKRRDEEEGDDSIFRYSNTLNVARDMLSIIHAWDEWRSGSSDKSAEEPDAALGLRTDSKIKSKDSTKGKLVYWGFSYGTLLGATFASMFPDKVGRLILDGVVDADHYVNPMLGDGITDTDAIWEKFFTYCADAGTECEFYRLGDTPGDIKERFNYIMSWLEKEPAVVLPLQSNVPVLVTAGDIKQQIFAALYYPIVIFPSIAILLKALVDNRLESMIPSPSPTPFCQNLTLPQWPDDAQKVIACSDKRYKLKEDADALQRRFEKMASYSSFADVWMGVDLNLGCSGWEIESKDPPMRWDDHPIHKPEAIETSFPVLFLSNHLDPVTPLHYALKMTRKFSGASLVEQKAEGHCTISCVSPCIVGHIRAYLNDGIVPPVPKYGSNDEGEWTTCKCYEKPWKSLDDMTMVSHSDRNSQGKIESEFLTGKTGEELETMEASRRLRTRFIEFTMSQQQFGDQNPLRNANLNSLNSLNKEQASCSKL